MLCYEALLIGQSWAFGSKTSDTSRFVVAPLALSNSFGCVCLR